PLRLGLDVDRRVRQPGALDELLEPQTAAAARHPVDLDRLGVECRVRHVTPHSCVQPALRACPPSTASATPVMNFASSEARKSAAFATSHAVPIRLFSGTCSLRWAMTSSREAPPSPTRFSIAMGVSMSPGRIALARMLSPACRIAMFWMSATTPAFEVL